MGEALTGGRVLCLACGAPTADGLFCRARHGLVSTCRCPVPSCSGEDRLLCCG